MSCECGTQVVLCNIPIRFDTYEGCSHECKYCFAQRKKNISHVKKYGTVQSLRYFIEGKRTQETAWCDWDIPIHWGGMSDPFQPIEKTVKASYECLQLFAETKYPFVVSTKGKLIIEPEYIELLEKCHCVVQISMVCSAYDKLELGAPCYEQRLHMAEILSKKVQRVIVRIQPYMPEVFHEVMNNIPKLAKAGVYGVVVEGMKFFKNKKGMVKVGADTCYPLQVLRPQFEAIRAECHKYGMKFYAGENRLRTMGDDMCCCGIDGLEGFQGNDYNICMIINGKNTKPTEKMKQIGTGMCYQSLYQSAGVNKKIKQQSFYGITQEELRNKTDYYKRFFGLKI